MDRIAGHRWRLIGEWLFRHRQAAVIAAATAFALAACFPGPPQDTLDTRSGDLVAMAGIVVSVVGMRLRLLVIDSDTPSPASHRSRRLADGFILYGLALATSSVWLLAVLLPAYVLALHGMAAAERGYLARLHGGDAADALLRRADYARWRAPHQPLIGCSMVQVERLRNALVMAIFVVIYGIHAIVVRAESPAEWIHGNHRWIFALWVFAGVAMLLSTVRHGHRQRTRALHH